MTEQVLLPYHLAFAERLSTLHNESRWSQGRVAFRLGVDQSSVSRWLSGDKVPSLPRVIALANYFDVDPQALLLDVAASAETDSRQEAMNLLPEHEVLAAVIAHHLATRPRTEAR